VYCDKTPYVSLTRFLLKNSKLLHNCVIILLKFKGDSINVKFTGTLLNVPWKSPGNLLGWICRHRVVVHVDVTEVSRGGYRGGMMMSRGSSLPSPRGMMRGAASGMPLMSRGSLAKAGPAWGGRNSRQMYGRPAFFRGYDAIC